MRATVSKVNDRIQPPSSRQKASARCTYGLPAERQCIGACSEQGFASGWCAVHAGTNCFISNGVQALPETPRACKLCLQRSEYKVWTDRMKLRHSGGGERWPRQRYSILLIGRPFFWHWAEIIYRSPDGRLAAESNGGETFPRASNHQPARGRSPSSL